MFGTIQKIQECVHEYFTSLKPRFRKFSERFGLAHVKHVFEPVSHLFGI